MRKLKVDKKKEFKVESVNISDPYLLPLSSFFNFNFSFLILPDIISDNMPVFFFIEYSKFFFSSYIVSLYPSY